MNNADITHMNYNKNKFNSVFYGRIKYVYLYPNDGRSNNYEQNKTQRKIKDRDD